MTATRGARKKAKTTSHVESQPEDHQTSALPVARVTQRRSNVGKLAGLVDLPVDILFEVLGHFTPLELLRMARLTKQFRRLLMSKSSISLWKSVIEKCPGLPPCPPYLNEPQWVNLAFDNFCHFCSATVRTVLWQLRTRMCTSCVKKHTTEEHLFRLVTSHMNVPYGAILSKFVPSRPATKASMRQYLKTEVEQVEKEYIAASKSPDELEKYEKQRTEFVEAINLHTKLSEDWLRNQNDDRQSQLYSIRKERREQIITKLEELGLAPELVIMKYPDLFDNHPDIKKPQRLTPRIWTNIKTSVVTWVEILHQRRLKEERKALVEKRKELAAGFLRQYKLANLPMQEPLPNAVEFCDLPPINTIVEQGDDIVVTEASFGPEFIGQIPELIKAWRARVDEQLVDHIQLSESRRPSFANDFWYDPEGEDPDSPDYPEHNNMLDTDFWGIAPTQDKTKLSSLIKLACTVFTCEECETIPLAPFRVIPPDVLCPDVNPMFYPRVLDHPCLTRDERDFNVFDDDHLGPVGQVMHFGMKRTACNFRSLRINYFMSRSAVSIISAAGMDPNTTTAVEMDAQKTWFACVACAVPADGRLDPTARECRVSVLNWRDAIVHQVTSHSPWQLPSWKKLGVKEVVRLICRELGCRSECSHDEDFMNNVWNLASDHVDRIKPIWRCVHCVDTIYETSEEDMEDMENHCEVLHDITNPILDIDYYRAYFASPAVPSLARRKMLRHQLTDDVTVIRMPITLEDQS